MFHPKPQTTLRKVQPYINFVQYTLIQSLSKNGYTITFIWPVAKQ